METRNKTKKKRNPVFIIILGDTCYWWRMVWHCKIHHSLHHEETDDAQVSADISPVIPRVAGYVPK